MEMNGNKKQDEAKQGLTLEQIAMMVLEDPMTTNELSEVLGKAVTTIWLIPYEILPFVSKKHSGKMHRLYSKRLVAKYLAENTRKMLKRDGHPIPERFKMG